MIFLAYGLAYGVAWVITATRAVFTATQIATWLAVYFPLAAINASKQVPRASLEGGK